MTETEAINKVQETLDGMRSEELGSMLSQANQLRKSGTREFDRKVGEFLYQQVLVALAYTRREG